jgi:FkbM family methyltransferase
MSNCNDSLIIALGAPYSGFNLLNKCLSCLGVEEFSTSINQDDIISSAIAEDIFRDLASNEATIDSFPQSLLASQDAIKVKLNIKKLITHAFSSSKILHICTPFFFRTFQLWSEALKEVGVPLKIIYIIRHPYEVALSYSRAVKRDLNWGAQFWLAWNKWALESCIHLPHVTLTFDQLLADPVTTMNQIGHKLDLPYPITPQKAANSLLNITQPNEKHAHVDSAILKERTFFHPYMHIFNCFRQLASYSPDLNSVEPYPFISADSDNEDSFITDSSSTFPPLRISSSEILRLLEQQTQHIQGNKNNDPNAKQANTSHQKTEDSIPNDLSTTATIILSNISGNLTVKNVILYTKKWQSIKTRLDISDISKQATIRFQPLPYNGIIKIKFIKVESGADSQVREMTTPEDFDAIYITPNTIRLPDKKNLLLTSTGREAEISWNLQEDAFGYNPKSIEILIKFQTDFNIASLDLSNISELLKDLFSQGRFTDALYIFNQCSALDFSAIQDSQLTHYLIGLLLDSGRILEAASCYEKALNAKQKNFGRPMEVGNALEKYNYLEEAEIFYRHVALSDPSNISAILARIKILYKLNRPDAASSLANQALNKFPESPLLHMELGAELLLQNERQTALQHFLLARKFGKNIPLWLSRALSALSSKIVELHDVCLRVPPDIVSTTVLRHMIMGNYEHAEKRLSRLIVQPGDSILELGGGIGYIACSILKAVKGVSMITVEANPVLIPLIKENLRLNNCQGIVIQGIASDRDGETTFHVSENFWASSTVEIPTGSSLISLATVDTNALISKFRPNKMIIDIEGGEVELIPKLHLDDIEALVIELHQRFTGSSGVSTVIRVLLEKGFEVDLDQSSKDVYLFTKNGQI